MAMIVCDVCSDGPMKDWTLANWRLELQNGNKVELCVGHQARLVRVLRDVLGSKTAAKLRFNAVV